MAKAAKYKMRFKSTPISRLSRMTVPFPMVGDPKWNHHASGKAAWESRERVVYAAMIEAKAWPYPWSKETWDGAWNRHAYIANLLYEKWIVYDEAWQDNIYLDIVQAERDNAVIDYHREHFLEPA